MQLDEQRLRFRDAMASLSAAVNIITHRGRRRTMRDYGNGRLLGHGYTTIADGVH